MKHASDEWKSYLEYIDGYTRDYVEEVPQCQAGNEGIWPVPHALVVVYNPQQGGVADQADDKHDNGNHGVDVLKVAANRGGHEAPRRPHRPLHDAVVSPPRRLCLDPRAEAGRPAGTAGAVETCRLQGGVDERAWERILICFSSVYLAHSSGCHTGH